MAPKRKRSPARARSRSRSPEKKRAKSPRKTKTSMYAAAKAEAPRYGTKKEMTAKLRSELTDKTNLPKDLFNIMEQYGNFDECDGPTDLGKLCLKGKEYFERVHNMNCTSYCGNENNCNVWMSDFLSQIPREITVVDAKDRMNAEIDSLHIDFEVEDGANPTSLTLNKYINIEEEKEMIEESKIELQHPYLWRVNLKIKKKLIADQLLNISDAEAIKYFCNILQKAQPWGDNYGLHVFVYYKGQSSIIGSNKPIKVKIAKLPSVLSDRLIETYWYPFKKEVEAHFSFPL
jgi:hypothetical protein